MQGFFVLVTDITERRRIEEEVAHGRARLADAERVARIGSWEWDIPANQLTCSEGLLAIYGIGPDDFDGRYDPSNTQYVHPDDREMVAAEMEQAVATGTPVDFEYRIIRPDGRVRRLHSRAELIADPAGNALRLTGTAQDVTELHAAAEVLHQTASDLGRRAAELRAPSRRARDDDLNKLLTPRQLEILALVAEGLSNAEIAARLYLTESTVKWHVRKILRALGVSEPGPGGGAIPVGSALTATCYPPPPHYFGKSASTAARNEAGSIAGKRYSSGSIWSNCARRSPGFTMPASTISCTSRKSWACPRSIFERAWATGSK